jgi:RHH-type proline utilization regulon transcriptional repressor/proline dehydrogenase/delta 1-pyrroline-5-carboxylate dehydrogenase
MNPKNIPTLKRLYEDFYRSPEDQVIKILLNSLNISKEIDLKIYKLGQELIQSIKKTPLSPFDILMKKYDLGSDQGRALMGLAEALLRIPDNATASLLIQDKLDQAMKEPSHTDDDSLFLKFIDFGLNLSDKIFDSAGNPSKNWIDTFQKALAKSSEPIAREGFKVFMKILGRHFILETSIKKAVKEARKEEKKGYTYSYDMLGEAARTQKDADRYYDHYAEAIHEIGKNATASTLNKRPGISVKLSALHPRYHYFHRTQTVKDLVPKVLELCLLAKENNIHLTIDAEEADRLDLSFDIIEQVFLDKKLDGWEGFGLALQAYQKRAFTAIDWLADLAKQAKRKLMIRLVKGAYWDTEIKLAQVEGLDYPVFTRKCNTDVSYIACAQKLLNYQDSIYPMFATHNAQTVATILELGSQKTFEFQRLHGMGQSLYNTILEKDDYNIPCRIYAPVGTHHDLLAYLVRRLLENGANSSFVHQLTSDSITEEEILANPIQKVKALNAIQHPKIPNPANLYKGYRNNSLGLDLSNATKLKALQMHIDGFAKTFPLQQGPTSSHAKSKETVTVTNPNNHSEIIGNIGKANKEDLTQILNKSEKAFETWVHTSAEHRAKIIEKAGEMMQQQENDLIALCVKEAGKNLPDAVAEVREAIDFCYYYAMRARELFQYPETLPSPTGELNQLSLYGRGTFLCISPWNFPLAIFVGQITAALVSGNCVIAKPAHTTPFIAARAVDILHKAGIPKDVLAYVNTSGELLSEVTLPKPVIKGVAFTGSVRTAHSINRTLAARDTEIIPFIAETGGLNAMIVDSTCLPERAVDDIILSAFRSAGQRCSALRLLFVQDDIYDNFIQMLKGAMDKLYIGDPVDLATDVSPVIDTDSQKNLEKHINHMIKDKGATLLHKTEMKTNLSKGSFVAPHLIELKQATDLTKEAFGPILHVVKYKAKDLDKTIDQINNSGFGLTFGLHTRIHSRMNYIRHRIHTGNMYVNRNMIGAVVGVQPFGGEGLSGTGPKAGGPHYLLRFVHERTYTEDTTASGGNTNLLSLED